MFTTFFSLALVLVFFKTVVAQCDFTIDTPTLTQCQSSAISWSDTDSGPYDLLVVSADDMCGEALVNLLNQTSTSTNWTVNLAAGTQVVLYIEDASGDSAWSGTITIGDSEDTSCLATGSTSPSSAPSSTPSSTPPSSVPSSTPSSTPPSSVLSSVIIPSATGGPVTPAVAASTPSSSAFAPAGAANAGLGPTSGALSTHPLSAAALVGSAALAVGLLAL